MQQILTYFFLVVYSVTILGIILVIITENRNPLKTLPWIVVLVLAPVVGLVIYFFFGQNLSKPRIISRRTRKRITMQLEEPEHPEGPGIPPRYRPLASLLLNTLHSVPLYGSRIAVYTDGRSKMEALIEEIARARHHIHIQYYILNDVQTGCRLRDALVAKARVGVRVRILYDDVGSRGAKNSFFKGMRDAGIEVYAFLHVKFPLFTSKVNYRNHRKIVVIAGRIGFIGGMNIADRYVRGTLWGTWLDTHFRIEGSGAAGLQASFLSDWSATTKTHISGPEYYPPGGHFTDDILQIAPSGPFGKWRALFGNDNPIHLEIGCGKGRFAIGMAEQHPDVNFIAVEREEGALIMAAERCQQQPLPNLRFVSFDAAELREVFAPGEVDRICLNFSDPWPKARHAKR